MQFENSAARIEFIEDTADLIEQGTRLDVTYNLKASDVNVSLENAIAFGSGKPRDDDFFVTEAKALRPLDVVSSRLSFESEKLDEGDRFVISTFDLPELAVIDGLEYANVKLNLGAGSEISSLNLEVSSDAFDNANQSVEVIAVVGGVETTVGTLDLDNTSLELSSDLVASVLDSDSKSLFLKLNLDIQRLMPADLQPKLVAGVRALEDNVEIDLPLLAFNTPNFDLAIADFTTYGETCKLDASSYLSFNKIDELVQEVIEYENQLFGNLTTSKFKIMNLIFNLDSIL